MEYVQVKVVAKQHGIKTLRRNKIELIRAIQRAEGNFDCFGTAYDDTCDQAACLWRSDCFDVSQRPNN
jgi:hypothetical protein